jgi:hypothetical protein
VVIDPEPVSLAFWGAIISAFRAITLEFLTAKGHELKNNRERTPMNAKGAPVPVERCLACEAVVSKAPGNSYTWPVYILYRGN